MKRVLVGTLMLAVCLLLGGTASAQAATTDERELTALYNAIFVDAASADGEGADADIAVDDVDGDGDIDADDYAAGGNVLCCASSGSCVRTTTVARCVGEPYNGKVCADVPDCRSKGCTC